MKKNELKDVLVFTAVLSCDYPVKVYCGKGGAVILSDTGTIYMNEMHGPTLKKIKFLEVISEAELKRIIK